MMAEKAEETIKVVVRCRPFTSREVARRFSKVVDVFPDQGAIEMYKSSDPKKRRKRFTFDAVYDSNSTQDDVYDESVLSLVNSVLEGFTGTVFAYGQTGTGKTYTMEGNLNSPEEKGVIPKCFDQIFDHIAKTENIKFMVRSSYVEIYNDEIRDLLQDCKKPMPKFELRENADLGVYVCGLPSHICKSVEEIHNLLSYGNKNRTVGQTNMNEDSSRSHAIFIITVEMSDSAPDGRSQVRVGKLNLVDLAGSEKQEKTGVEMNRLKESAKINLALSALGNVIKALSDPKSRHIPYRDSTLTRLLQDSLGGNAKTVMIATIGPANYNYDESMSTLRYAQRAKNIKNKPRINEDPKDALLRNYEAEIIKLKAILAEREAQKTAPKKPKKKKKQFATSDEEWQDDSGSNMSKSSQDLMQEDYSDRMKKQDKILKNKTLLETSGKTDSRSQAKDISNLSEMERQYALETDALKAHIMSMESKILMYCGEKDIVDVTNNKQKMLRQKEVEIREQRMREIKLHQEIDALEGRKQEVQETVQNLQQIVATKEQRYKALGAKLHSINIKFQEGQETNSNDMRFMEDSLKDLHQMLKLFTKVMDNFIPHDERRDALSQLFYDKKSSKWKQLPDSELPTELGILVSSSYMRRPTTQYEKAAAKMGINNRFRGENILDYGLQFISCSTYLYEPPAVSPSIKSVLELALQGEEDLDVDASAITKSATPRTRLTLPTAKYRPPNLTPRSANTDIREPEAVGSSKAAMNKQLGSYRNTQLRQADKYPQPRGYFPK